MQADGPAVAQPAADAVPATASVVKMTSTPEGAELYQNGALMGKLPFDLVKPKAGEPAVTYVVKMTGYDDMEIVVSASTPDAFPIELDKAKRHDKKKGSGDEAGAAKPSTQEPAAEEPIKVKVKKKNEHSDLADPWG